jgi:surface protein
MSKDHLMSYFRVMFKEACQAFKQRSVVLAPLLLLTISTKAYAECEVNGISYRTNGDNSGTYITLSNLTSQASSWNNDTDRVTTCDVSQITDLSLAFFNNSAFNQDLSQWDTSAVTNMFAMFYDASAFNQDLSQWDTSAVTNMYAMFYDASSLTSVSLPDTSAVTNMYAMFYKASSLTSVSLPKTPAVTNMNSMFRNTSSLTSVSLSDTPAVTDMSYMFNGASSLSSVSLSDTSAVTDMRNMFNGASSLTSVSLPDTSAVTNMSYMFRNASSLTSVSLPHTSAVTNMYAMFYDASSLTSVSLSDTSAVTYMSYMFNGASSFAQDIRYWDVSSDPDFNEMFENATAMINAFSSTPNWSTTPSADWFTPVDRVAPTIAITSINTANTELTVTFSEGVYNTAGGTGDLEATDFALSIDGGVATLGSATPTSITKTSQSVWVLGFSTSGTANGSETITVVPASSTSIYDAAANAAATSQSNNTALLVERVAPTVTLTGPSGNVTTAFTVTATFSEAVTGFALDDITVANGTISSLVTGNAPVYTFTVTPTLGTIVTVSIAANKVTDTAGNANTASNTFSIQAYSPASEFEKHKTAIKSVITAETKRALRSSLASDQRMVRNSLDRFIADQSGPDANQDVAFVVDGSAKLKATHLDFEATAKGNFFSQQAAGDETWRKLTFGDFNLQTDDAKNVSGFLKWRMAVETNLNSTTMLGYFVGGQVGRSTLKGTFEGSQNSFGASVGGYLVQTLAKDVYADLFASLGANRNTLKLSNGTLDLDSFYSTTTSTIGGSVTGVYIMDGFEVWPALTFTYGKTNVGNVDFTGKAYGITDTTLSLDAGKVHLTSVSFTPEIRMPFELQEGSDTSSMVTIAPRYTCEQTSRNSSSRNCGSGAAIGLTTASEDGLTDLNAQFQYDKIGSTTRRSLQLGFERRF